MTRISAFLMAVIVAGGLGETFAQQLSVHATVDSSRYLLGDPITVHLALRFTPGTTVQPVIGDTASSFAVLQKSGIERSSDSTAAMTVVFAKYDSGDAEIPALPFLFYKGGDTAQRYAFSNPLLVSVQPVPMDTSSEIRDVKPPISIPMPIEEILLYVAIALVAGAGGYLLWRWWQRRKAVASGMVPGLPPKPAHVIALEELGILKDKKLWQQGRIKEYYSEATEILRRYLENRYNQPALEETTDEIMNGLRTRNLTDHVLGTLERMLRRADLVKFAKHQPSIPEHEEMLTAAFDIVEKTRLVTISPPPEAVTEPTDVGR